MNENTLYSGWVEKKTTIIIWFTLAWVLKNVLQAQTTLNIKIINYTKYRTKNKYILAKWKWNSVICAKLSRGSVQQPIEKREKMNSWFGKQSYHPSDGSQRKKSLVGRMKRRKQAINANQIKKIWTVPYGLQTIEKNGNSGKKVKIPCISDPCWFNAKLMNRWTRFFASRKIGIWQIKNLECSFSWEKVSLTPKPFSFQIREMQKKIVVTQLLAVTASRH